MRDPAARILQNAGLCTICRMRDPGVNLQNAVLGRIYKMRARDICRMRDCALFAECGTLGRICRMRYSGVFTECGPATFAECGTLYLGTTYRYALDLCETYLLRSPRVMCVVWYVNQKI